MDTTHLVSNFLDWNGSRVKLTWCPGQDLTLFQPFTQVYGVVFNKNGDILLQRHGPKQWNLPGGTVESDETAEETLRRELLEEADVTVKNLMLLGGQRTQFVDSPNPNPGERGGDDFYQLRYYCEVDELLPQTPDPDHGTINERLFVPHDEVNQYLHWGTVGQAIFDQAIDLWHKFHDHEDSASRQVSVS